jgi:hypothetical protein
MTLLTVEQLCDIAKTNKQKYYSKTYIDIINELKDNDYVNATPNNIDNNFDGLFTLHKWCVVGSSIAREGLLAPLQMQFRTKDTFVPHPGADRYMILDAIGIKELFVQWDFPDYIIKRPDLKYNLITNPTQLRCYYKNWNTSLVYLADYKVTDTKQDHEAFMTTFIDGVNSYAKDIGFTSDKTYQRFEIKNSKSLFWGMAQETERFMNAIKLTENSITAGPFTLTEDNLYFDGGNLW